MKFLINFVVSMIFGFAVARYDIKNPNIIAGGIILIIVITFLTQLFNL